MNKLFVTLLLLFTFGILPAYAADYKMVKPEKVGLSSERLKNMDRLIDRYVEEKKIAGAVVMVARKGKIAYFKETGLADVGKPMQKDTIFRIVSMTKPITSTAIMMLYEEGKLLLSDPVAKYIPEFRNQKVLVPNPPGSDFPYHLVPVKREVQVRDLLAHTSGILYLFLNDVYPNPTRTMVTDLYKEAGITDGFCRPDETIGDMVKRLAKLPLYAHPGEVWDYGLNSDILGYLVEVVSGMKFDQFVEQRIFKPLKMNDSHFYIPEEKLPRLAAVWKSDWKGSLVRADDKPIISGDLCLNPADAEALSGKYLAGGANVLSTVYDYFRFAQMYLNGGELDGVRLLSRKTVELMTATNHIGEHDAEFLHSKGWKFGLGFAIQADREHPVDSGDVGTYEWAGIYSTRFSVDPKEEKITIFMSQTNPFGHHFELWDKVLVQSASAVGD
ncbi:CubicO group peptidase, beta-lactamase class C family [Mariprofundus aestuarium]|uniref:CubicO group peptidase, beta-lactamase class C family n=1 Tax=Mariprofundus aestuarium TaxID=1921086 RepID=A0A2K8KXQ5_MARES|nr:serine hydrolase domain-containing protein [Mariprofundus aestuarium]ATX79502.1 CubicO group peptidase, beta-lactamase class C family [Mariprofundus aestuarium]